jgi:hypothetical protein
MPSMLFLQTEPVIWKEKSHLMLKNAGNRTQNGIVGIHYPQKNFLIDDQDGSGMVNKIAGILEIALLKENATLYGDINRFRKTRIKAQDAIERLTNKN